MEFPELAAFEEEARGVEETLEGVPAEAWGRPALGEWTVAELVAHLVRAATRVAVYLDVEVDAEEPAVDRVGYCRFDFTTEAAAIAARARQEAHGVEPGELVARFRDGWRTSAGRGGGLTPDHLIATPRGPMCLDEYLATRVLELVVHHGDLRVALDLAPAPAPEPARMTQRLLESLLGGPMPRNLGRDRFIRAATGRVAIDDPRFPVLR
ncbi:MAG TPA: maleylpyruvate isomerase N-terminal domain-containing protein [Egibacteraceae bacterium]|nr:maleylpyruvate isomerase N-terminal domain-containing protein [Egibacteraceae bacterium]